MDRNHENADSISKIRSVQETLIKDMQTFIDNMSKSMSIFEEAVIELDERCFEMEYNLSEINKNNILSKDSASYINESYNLHERFSFPGVNFECLKLYLSMKDRVFIYAITNKIVFDSSIGEMQIKPGYHIEDEWGDFVYINIKLDNVDNNFNVHFNYVDNGLFWGVNFKDGHVCVVTDSSSGASVQRDNYVRLLFDSNKSEFVGIGSGKDFSNISISKCKVECNFLKNWLLSPSSRVHIINCDTRHFKLEVNGMVVTA